MEERRGKYEQKRDTLGAEIHKKGCYMQRGVWYTQGEITKSTYRGGRGGWFSRGDRLGHSEEVNIRRDDCAW